MASAKNTAQVPAFEATAIESIPETCATIRSSVRSNKTKDLEWRKVQLRKLYWALTDFSQMIFAAFEQDLKKSEYEATLTEINMVQNACMFMLEHLDKFAKDEYLGSPHVPLPFSLAGFRTRKEPLGAVLIIGTYNYPLYLCLCPLVGAIAAGCTAVVKPSEGAPAVAMAMRALLEARLDRTAFAVVNGGVPATTALLDQKWDKIFYTGSTQVGTIIARKAAETLTPVTLELGGRNPAFVTKNANLQLAAKRLLWSKTMNAGQTCVSQNYVLVERDVVDDFIRELKVAFKGFFPNGVRDSDLVKIINERQFLRMKKMLDETKGKIVLGGQMDQESLFIEPTAELVSSVDDSMMKDESFGPIFSIYPFSTLSEAIDIANTVEPTPLALYSQGTKAENERGMISPPPTPGGGLPSPSLPGRYHQADKLIFLAPYL